MEIFIEENEFIDFQAFISKKFEAFKEILKSHIFDNLSNKKIKVYKIKININFNIFERI